jgi:transcriptional regulator with XRE-family HTH domain
MESDRELINATHSPYSFFYENKIGSMRPKKSWKYSPWAIHGADLARLREFAGLTQQQVGRRIGVASSRVPTFEGQERVTRRVVVRALEAIIKELRLNPGPAVDLDYRPEDWGFLPLQDKQAPPSRFKRRSRTSSRP